MVGEKKSISKENEAPKEDAPKKRNILHMDSIFSCENTDMVEDDVFYKLLLPKRSAIINLSKRSGSNPKDDAKFVVALYRLRLNTLSIKEDFYGVQETVKDYNSWMKYIIRAGGFAKGFDLFHISIKDIEGGIEALKKARTKEVLQSASGGKVNLKEIPYEDEFVSGQELIYTADTNDIWGGQEERFLVKENSTKQNVAWFRQEWGKKGSPP